MSWLTAAGIYFIIWWVVLFAVLPWGVRSQHEGERMAPGTEPGAPIAPLMLRKVIWTTVVSTIIFAMLAAIVMFDLITLEDFDALLGFRKY